MDEFPDDYVAHNLPLLLLSGLGPDPSNLPITSQRSKSLLQEGGFRLKSVLEPVTDSGADVLLQAFLDHDASKRKWNGASVTNSRHSYHIRRVGRVGQTLHLVHIHR